MLHARPFVGGVPLYRQVQSGIEDMGVIGYGEGAPAPGVWMMDAPAAAVENVTALAAGGAQLVCFVTGTGNPTGHPLSPTVKISANPRTVDRMVKRKRRGAMRRQGVPERHRVSGNALVSRPSARLGAPFCVRCRFARESWDPGPHDVLRPLRSWVTRLARI